MTNFSPPHTNRLAKSASPYLLQHQHNPVDWFPWGDEALKRAEEEDKPIILSIGYSACHWCHVMERESFEDEEVAAFMNREYICIKVDREERPDVDQIYMEAIHAMGLQGGWPLNVFLTPDRKPFYGGTYFPKQNWLQLVRNVAIAFRKNRRELEDSARKFTDALALSDLLKYGLDRIDTQFSKKQLSNFYEKFSKAFDRKRGGLNPAPKFPMPSHWLFLLRFYSITGDVDALEHLNLTLTEMARGGIYDQLGGGFSRYSVDAGWFAPHFEKMLYDNGQLISLYSAAFTATKNPYYKKVVYQTIEWAEGEMLSPEGGFYAALDADSEGEEGKYYCWTYTEVEDVLGNEAEIFCDYYNLDEPGNWEKGKNILHRREGTADFAKKYDLDLADFEELLLAAEQKLLNARQKRIRPGLDDKQLAGWNGLMLSGLADAYAAFGETRFLELALRNANFIDKNLETEGRLWRNFKKGEADILACLEDYAFVIQGYLRLYEVCFDEKWLLKAKKLTKYTLDNFWDEQEKLFFYTDATSERLIARKKELFDNVIPSSNSAMAMNLHRMGLLLDIRKYQQLAKEMVGTLHKLLKSEPQYFTYLACLYADIVQPTAEIVIVGPQYREFSQEIHQQNYFPNKVMCAAREGGDLPLLENRAWEGGDTTIYVCYDRSCLRPVHSPAEALGLLRDRS